jgi:hypothetical protein
MKRITSISAKGCRKKTSAGSMTAQRAGSFVCVERDNISARRGSRQR